MKDAMICFRIGKRLRGPERISQEDRRSLSSTVEYILHDHIARRALETLAKRGGVICAGPSPSRPS